MKTYTCLFNNQFIVRNKHLKENIIQQNKCIEYKLTISIDYLKLILFENIY